MEGVKKKICYSLTETLPLLLLWELQYYVTMLVSLLLWHCACTRHLNRLAVQWPVCAVDPRQYPRQAWWVRIKKNRESWFFFFFSSGLFQSHRWVCHPGYQVSVALLVFFNTTLNVLDSIANIWYLQSGVWVKANHLGNKLYCFVHQSCSTGA